jgi:hypothetical protein
LVLVESFFFQKIPAIDTIAGATDFGSGTLEVVEAGALFPFQLTKLLGKFNYTETSSSAFFPNLRQWLGLLTETPHTK